jgi:hypothetical protein
LNIGCVLKLVEKSEIPEKYIYNAPEYNIITGKNKIVKRENHFYKYTFEFDRYHPINNNAFFETIENCLLTNMPNISSNSNSNSNSNNNMNISPDSIKSINKKTSPIFKTSRKPRNNRRTYTTRQSTRLSSIKKTRKTKRRNY